MDHGQTGPLQPFNNEVSVGNGVHRVLADRVKSELLPEKLAVERVRVTSESGGTEGENRNPGVKLAETLQVGEERLGVGQEQVGPSDGLGTLRFSFQ